MTKKKNLNMKMLETACKYLENIGKLLQKVLGACVSKEKLEIAGNFWRFWYVFCEHTVMLKTQGSTVPNEIIQTMLDTSNFHFLRDKDALTYNDATSRQN